MTVWLCETVPLRPVTVNEYVPFEERLALTVSVDVHPDAALADEGENDALVRRGRLVALSDTEVGLLIGVIVTV